MTRGMAATVGTSYLAFLVMVSMSGGPGDDTIGNNFFEFGDDTLDSRDGVVNNDLDGGPDTDTCNSDPDPEFSCELNRARSSNSSHATLSNYAYFAILGRFTPIIYS
jgi:hypothetical protein